MVVVTLVVLALLAPELVDVYGELSKADSLSWGWLVAGLVSVAAQLLATIELHRVLLRTSKWLDVGAPILAGNAASHLAPGGNAVGAGVEVHMLLDAGFPLARIGTTLAAVTIIGVFGGFVGLPLLVLGASAAGTDIDSRLIPPLWFGVLGLTVVLGLVVLTAVRDRPWLLLARAITRIETRFRRPGRSEPLAGRLLAERDQILESVRGRPTRVALLEVGRELGDFSALYCAVRATGANVNPAAVLAAFIVANLAGMIPLTPGGLGFVETGLTGVITFAGASTVHANLAVATYRIGATWLPCLAGVIAIALFRRRQRELARIEASFTPPELWPDSGAPRGTPPTAASNTDSASPLQPDP